MKRKLLNTKKIPPACEYCARGELSPDGRSVLCHKRGVMRRSSGCRSFSYDPLKRQPKLPLELPRFDREDFEL